MGKSQETKENQMNTFILADYSGAAGGISAMVLFFAFLMLIYSVLCFLVPVFIYRIMRRGTEAADTLRRIEAHLFNQTPVQLGIQAAQQGASTVQRAATARTIDDVNKAIGYEPEKGMAKWTDKGWVKG
jgi:hypothetical protein